MFFKIQSNDTQSSARTGIIQTDHGCIETPIFMPVGTNGTVKGVHFKELEHDIKAQIILCNTYHLYLRAGINMLEGAGGLHKFNGWNKPILTDSGGYQVYSLAHARKITENGAIFKSFLDGSKHTFTPENVMDIQRSIGADIIMAFDECTPYPCEFAYARNSMEMTHRWLTRCKNRFIETEPKYGYKQFLFPIVQGSTYPELRKQSAEFVANQDFEANAIGGLSVGEPAEEMYAMTDIVTQILPKSKPRYMMGVGTPANILECIALGIDMFDCVMPTRNARNGGLFTSEGIINIRNEKWKYDYSPIDENLAGNSQEYSKAYLKHLLKHDEMLGCMIASVHNLQFYLWLVGEARTQIQNGTFTSWKNKMVEKVSRKL